MILTALISKDPNGKQLPSHKKSGQNIEKNQSYETFYGGVSVPLFFFHFLDCL